MEKLKIVSFLIVASLLIFCFVGRVLNGKIWTINYEHDTALRGSTQMRSTNIISNVDTIDDVVNVAKKINASPVMVTFVNDAYLLLVYNWLCNTVNMNVHHRVLFITTSQSTKEKIETKYNNVTICVIEVDEYLRDDQSYGQVGYVKLMIIRTRIITALLLGGIETFQFECDFLWIKNPIEMLHEYKGRYDALFLKNYESEVDVNGGFLYLFATNRTQTLFVEVRRMMNLLETNIKHLPKNQGLPDKDNDQFYLSRLLNKQFAGVKTLVLPYTDFADGKWYTFNANKRKSIKPYMIHNDYIAGNQAKINRIKQWGHWFLNEDNICKIEKLKSAAVDFF